MVLLAATFMVGADDSVAQATLLGAVGCSQTEGAMVGHHEAGYSDSWDMAGAGYGGGAIHDWTPGRAKYWDRFETLLAQYPQTTDIFWMLCLRDPGSPVPTDADYEAVEDIAAEIAARAPGTTIWVSPMNDFEGVVCPISGTTGPIVAQTLADHVAAQGWAARGPDVSPLTPATVSPDDCHPNETGRIMWGEDLQAFFFEGGNSFIGSFSDDDGNVHESNIETIAAAGITTGCGGTRYCPAASVSRGQMASFLARMLALPTATTDHFTDDDGDTHEASINAVATAGIALGTGNGEFRPDSPVTRDQMASLLARALNLASAPTDYFTDDAGNTHEAAINTIRAHGITYGCDTTGTQYCPRDRVRRDQMASFLARSLVLLP